MNILLLILSGLVGIASLVCTVLILIEAFQDELWKGIVSLVFPPYFLYYAFFDYDSENKWLVIIGAFGGGAICSGILGLIH